MKLAITSVTDRKETAKALNLYFGSAMDAEAESRFMTYHDSLYSGELVRQTDLFIFELFATDAAGAYTEGIFAAEKWISLGKRILILSGSARAQEINSLLYWDLAARDALRERVFAVVEAPRPRSSELASLRAYFSKSPCFRHGEDPHDRHATPRCIGPARGSA